MATPKPAPVKYLLSLGGIEFSAVQGLTAWDESEGANLPKHSVIKGKPRMQFLGMELIEINLTLKLFRKLNSIPIESRMAQLRMAERKGQIMPLVLGTGSFKGNYVIKGLGFKPGKMLPDGTLLWAEVNLGLEEYVAASALRLSIADPPGVAKDTGTPPETKRGR